jgi:hypothetical protein
MTRTLVGGPLASRLTRKRFEGETCAKDGIVKLAVLATIFVMGAPLWAQDAPAATSQDQSGATDAQAAPEHGGPALLNRGDAPSVLSGSDVARLHPFLGVTGTYFGGGGPYPDSYGISGMFGVTGAHTWAHSVLSVDYHGFYREFTNGTLPSGLDNSVSLSFQHQLSERLSLSLNESLSRIRNGFSLPVGGLYGGGTAFNPLYNALTANGLTMTPTLASVGGAQIVYQATERLSVSAGGSGILSRQYFTQTIGANGWIANGDVAYRLNRYQTISFGYSFSHFGYVGQVGQSDMHTFGLSYSIRIGRYWEFGATGGVTRSESLGQTEVALDPILAQLLGFNTVLENVHDVFYMPSGALHLTRAFHHGSWSANYNRSVVGGAGLFSTASYETAGSAYSYWGLRRVNLDAGAGYYRFSAMGQSIGLYRAFGVSAGFSIPMGRGFSSIGRFDTRHYAVSNSQAAGNSYNASFGFSWSPDSYPVSLW